MSDGVDDLSLTRRGRTLLAGRMTRAEYDALPSRSSTGSYEPGNHYRDACRDLTTFLHLGPETDPVTRFPTGRPGLAPLDGWRAWAVGIVEVEDILRTGELLEGPHDGNQLTRLLEQAHETV